MGAAQFDREAFVTPKESPSRASLSVPIPFVLAIMILMLLGFGLYEFGVARRHANGGPGEIAEVMQLKQKLTMMDRRLDQLEKRRKATSIVAPAEPPTSTSSNRPEPSQPRTVTRTVYRISPPSASVSGTSASRIPQRDAQVALQDQQISSLRNEVAASREEWEATADRLGSVVGELGSQRSEIETLSQSVDHSQRRDYTFTLERKSGPQRIGPLALWLQSADPRTGRYTMRVLVNDKWIEFKNRSLHEAVEFYTDGQDRPVEMVVDGISRDQTVGNLGIR